VEVVHEIRRMRDGKMITMIVREHGHYIVNTRCIVLPWVAVCCSLLQCVAVCCIVVTIVATECVAVCCSVLQCRHYSHYRVKARRWW